MADVDLVLIAHGRSSQAPPAPVVWDVLNAPLGDHRWTWLVIRDDEQAPAVLSGTRPSELVWDSLWPAWPDLRLHFEVGATEFGSMIHWNLLGPPELLDAEEAEACRYRISYLMNDLEGLRGVFSQ